MKIVKYITNDKVQFLFGIIKHKLASDSLYWIMFWFCNEIFVIEQIRSHN